MIDKPEACAHVAIAEPAPDGFAAPRLAELIASADIASEIILPGEWHLVFVADGRRAANHRRAVEVSAFALHGERVA